MTLKSPMTNHSEPNQSNNEQRLTSTIFKAKIRKSPHISESYCISHAGEGEVPLAAPCPSFIRNHFFLLLLLFGRDIVTSAGGLVDQISKRFSESLILRNYHHVDMLARAGVTCANPAAVLNTLSYETKARANVDSGSRSGHPPIFIRLKGALKIPILIKSLKLKIQL